MQSLKKMDVVEFCWLYTHALPLRSEPFQVCLAGTEAILKVDSYISLTGREHAREQTHV